MVSIYSPLNSTNALPQGQPRANAHNESGSLNQVEKGDHNEAVRSKEAQAAQSTGAAISPSAEDHQLVEQLKAL